MKALHWIVFALTALVVVGCSSSDNPTNTELAEVLDEAADREGVPPGECREACLKLALEVFDECTAESDDREGCFAKAIRSFFDCAKECPPPTCEDRCEARARQHYMECKDDGGDEDACAAEGREVLARCKAMNCEEPPTCKEECEAHAKEVYDRCVADGAGGSGGDGGSGGIAIMPKGSGPGGAGG